MYENIYNNIIFQDFLLQERNLISTSAFNYFIVFAYTVITVLEKSSFESRLLFLFVKNRLFCFNALNISANHMSL